MALILDVDDLLDNPLAVLLVPVNDVRGQSRADEAVAGIRIVVEADLQRDEAILTEIDRLIDALVREVPEMNLATVLEVTDLLEVEPGHKGVRRGPFTR